MDCRKRIVHILPVLFSMILYCRPATAQHGPPTTWVPDPATYANGTQSVIQSGNSHYTIQVGVEYGGVDCYADPVEGGSCDVEVTIGFNWHFAGNINIIYPLGVTANGVLYGAGPWPQPQVRLLSSLMTYGLTATADTNTVPGPYEFTATGQPQIFQPRPPSNKIQVTGQIHSIATLPPGPFQNGASASTFIHW